MSANDKKLYTDLDSAMKTMVKKETVLEEEFFEKVISMELARVIRTSSCMCIGTINVNALISSKTCENIKDKYGCICKSIEKLKGDIRENDFIGWIKKNEEIGILFTGIKCDVEKILKKKLVDHLKSVVTNEDILTLALNITKFPMDANNEKNENAVIVKTLFKKKKQYTKL
jgi:hypothetical protein